jgi:hypothetical protein
MSVISTAANYGGKILDFKQGIKQFVIGLEDDELWTFQKLSNGLMVQTPADSGTPILINNDLIVTGSIFNTSDARLKNNIKEITKEDMENLFSLNPINFKYIKNSKKTHYGFLAQDVEKIFPQLVENNNDGYKTVNYQELIPLMLAKMRDMQN